MTCEKYIFMKNHSQSLRKYKKISKLLPVKCRLFLRESSIFSNVGIRFKCRLLHINLICSFSLHSDTRTPWGTLSYPSQSHAEVSSPPACLHHRVIQHGTQIHAKLPRVKRSWHHFGHLKYSIIFIINLSNAKWLLLTIFRKLIPVWMRCQQNLTLFPSWIYIVTIHQRSSWYSTILWSTMDICLRRSYN